jgi:hypothetical protein
VLGPSRPSTYWTDAWTLPSQHLRLGPILIPILIAPGPSTRAASLYCPACRRRSPPPPHPTARPLPCPHRSPRLLPPLTAPYPRCLPPPLPHRLPRHHLSLARTAENLLRCLTYYHGMGPIQIAPGPSTRVASLCCLAYRRRSPPPHPAACPSLPSPLAPPAVAACHPLPPLLAPSSTPPLAPLPPPPRARR